MENQKGYMGFILIAIIVMGIFFAGGLGKFIYSSVPTGIYQPVAPPVQNSQNSLQLQTLTFIAITPPVQATGQQAGSCGYAKINSAEPEILYAFSPDSSQVANSGTSIKLWYTDEHAVTLGIGAVTPMKQKPVDTATNPSVGDQAKRDSHGFPFFPALFLTDITTDSTSNAGDAEHGGVPHPPTAIFGSWKANGGGDPNPKNGWNLGSGADPFPAVSNVNIKGSEGRDKDYGAEIIWDVGNLGLTPGKTYRAQFIVHDGDSDNGAGDIGEGCTIIQT